jgi:hypothetical protein
MDSPEVITYIKNIIKNQKRFNYDSLLDISNFADCIDKKGITPLFYYCTKGNDEKALLILNTPNFITNPVKDYFDEAAYNRMPKTCLKMLEKDIEPFNFGETFVLCLNKKMEEVAIEMLSRFKITDDIPFYKNHKIINPIIYCIRNKLDKLLEKLLPHYLYFDNYNFNGVHIFFYACRYNSEITLKYVLENKKISNEIFDEKSLSYLFTNRNDNFLSQILSYMIQHNPTNKYFVKDYLTKKARDLELLNFTNCLVLLKEIPLTITDTPRVFDKQFYLKK